MKCLFAWRHKIVIFLKNKKGNFIYFQLKHKLSLSFFFFLINRRKVRWQLFNQNIFKAMIEHLNTESWKRSLSK